MSWNISASFTHKCLLKYSLFWGRLCSTSLVSQLKDSFYPNLNSYLIQKGSLNKHSTLQNQRHSISDEVGDANGCQSYRQSVSIYRRTNDLPIDESFDAMF